jgi:hypothetical protein
MHSCTCEQSAATSRSWHSPGEEAHVEGMLLNEASKLPSDLRDWASPWQIRTWIYEAMGGLDGDNSLPGQDPQRQNDEE